MGNLFKINNKDTKTTPHWVHFGVSSVGFEFTSPLMFPLLILNK